MNSSQFKLGACNDFFLYSLLEGWIDCSIYVFEISLFRGFTACNYSVSLFQFSDVCGSKGQPTILGKNSIFFCKYIARRSFHSWLKFNSYYNSFLLLLCHRKLMKSERFHLKTPRRILIQWKQNLQLLLVWRIHTSQLFDNG